MKSKILAQCKEIWAEGARAGNTVKGHRFFTVSMPLFLSLVLQECKHITDLPKVLSQIRDSKEARAFRDWTSYMSGETNLSKFLKEYKEVEHLTNSLMSDLGAVQKNSTLQIGLSPSLTISMDDVTTRLSEIRKPHLRFIRRLLTSTKKNARLEDTLCKLFPIDSDFAAETVTLLDST